MPIHQPPRYQQLADELSRQIRQGILQPGEAVLSVRRACQVFDVSPVTITQAYYLLESQGLIEARPRSGYYVRTRLPQVLNAPAMTAPTTDAAELEVSDFIFQILDSVKDPVFLPLGSSFPDPALFPLEKLGQHLAKAARHLTPMDTVAHLSPGHEGLRRQIALRYLAQGASVSPSDIIVVSGAMEGLNLCLQAVTRPGDVVAIESPAFYAGLQAIERLGLKAIEIPTHPHEGVNIPALAAALQKHPVKACLFMLNFQNPMGGVVPRANRQALLALLRQYDVPLIEDDVYAELHFPDALPVCTKQDDPTRQVMHVSSFSKSLAPGYRIGWVAAGKYAEKVRRLKLATSLATSIPVQMGLAAYLQSGGFDNHLRHLRQQLMRQAEQMMNSLSRYFPVGTRVAVPTGGYFLWVELPEGHDALAIHQRALAQGISVAPGPIFSARGGYAHCLRLNFGHTHLSPAGDSIEKLSRLLG
ncbi:aminotransferase-like domain-containing protein [Leeia oryzae]|uniref:aminotransferase-like domain-containing protein n=1 Tax=Leeia oryzae TaxID=356662 RepID=UPI00036DBA81|nr:PLP-dependent aminotransferase family protein [Leeia oryzae]